MIIANSSLAHLRIASDMLHLGLVIDEYTDRADGNVAKDIARAVTGALRDPFAVPVRGELVLAEITRQ